MRRLIFRGAAACAGLSLLAGSARSDITFGGNARALAMGGAGLAIVDRAGRNTLVNPASLALLNRRVLVEYPDLGFRASGIPLGEAFDHLTGNPDKNDAASLARDFGKRNSSFGVNLGWGVRLAHLDVRATGVATVRVLPDEKFQTWAKTANGDVTQLDPTARADILGAAIYSLPTIGVAERISPPGSPTRIEAGARVKLMRAIYSHYVARLNTAGTDIEAIVAPELGSGTTLTKDGIGIDAGFLVHPRDYEGFSGALVITNLIEPSFRFIGTDTTGAPARYDLQPRSASVGAAWHRGRVITAFDMVDLTHAYGDVQVRLGAEYSTRSVAFRAGYASARGFTVGFGWRWINIAYGQRSPLAVSHFLRF